MVWSTVAIGGLLSMASPVWVAYGIAAVFDLAWIGFMVSGKLRDGALDTQRAFGDLDGHRPALLAVQDTVDDDTAYRAELFGGLI
ncbi:hypothetical protein ACWEBX_01050 [Streptomyces sp. NPDC005070]